MSPSKSRCAGSPGVGGCTGSLGNDICASLTVIEIVVIGMSAYRQVRTDRRDGNVNAKKENALWK